MCILPKKIHFYETPRTFPYSSLPFAQERIQVNLSRNSAQKKKTTAPEKLRHPSDLGYSCAHLFSSDAAVRRLRNLPRLVSCHECHVCYYVVRVCHRVPTTAAARASRRRDSVTPLLGLQCPCTPVSQSLAPQVLW